MLDSDAKPRSACVCIVLSAMSADSGRAAVDLVECSLLPAVHVMNAHPTKSRLAGRGARAIPADPGPDAGRRRRRRAQDKQLYWQRYDVDLTRRRTATCASTRPRSWSSPTALSASASARFRRTGSARSRTSRSARRAGRSMDTPKRRAVHLPRLPGRRQPRSATTSRPPRQPAHDRHRLHVSGAPALLPRERRRPAVLEGDPGRQPLPHASLP